MLAALIDKGRRRLLANYFETTTNQHEAIICQIGNRRRKIRPALKPRLDSVLIRALHVEEMPRLEGMQMIVENLCGDGIGSVGSPDHGKKNDENGDAGRRDSENGDAP